MMETKPQGLTGICTMICNITTMISYHPKIGDDTRGTSVLKMFCIVFARDGIIVSIFRHLHGTASSNLHPALIYRRGILCYEGSRQIPRITWREEFMLFE